MKIATWNVNGIRARETQFSDWVAAEKPDVICLQELKASTAQIPESICDLNGYWCYWHGSVGKAYSGVGLHLRRETFPDQPDFTHPEFDNETRIVEANVGDTTYASVYVPNGGKDFDAKLRFFGTLAAWASEARSADRSLVICGDLNVAREDRDVHQKERKANQIGTRPDERALLNRLIDDGLIDVGRALDPANDNLFTWWPPWRNMRQRNIGWRIDYILASPAIAARAEACGVLAQVGTSDHAPVVMIATG